jgi:hypothetical protein
VPDKVAKSEKPANRRGGRKAGIPNKRTLEVQEKLAALGCDPIEGMARIASIAEGDGMKKLIAAAADEDPESRSLALRDGFHDLQLAGKMYAELAGYVAPKRKAVEVSASKGEGDFTLEELLATYRRATLGP